MRTTHSENSVGEVGVWFRDTFHRVGVLVVSHSCASASHSCEEERHHTPFATDESTERVDESAKLPNQITSLHVLTKLITQWFIIMSSHRKQINRKQIKSVRTHFGQTYLAMAKCCSRRAYLLTSCLKHMFQVFSFSIILHIFLEYFN